MQRFLDSSSRMSDPVDTDGYESDPCLQLVLPILFLSRLWKPCLIRRGVKVEGRPEVAPGSPSTVESGVMALFWSGSLLTRHLQSLQAYTYLNEGERLLKILKKEKSWSHTFESATFYGLKGQVRNH